MYRLWIASTHMCQINTENGEFNTWIIKFGQMRHSQC